MANAYEMYQARQNFDALCQMLDHKGWYYDKIEDKLLIKSGVKSEDLPVEFIVRVVPDNQVVQFLSKLSFQMPEEKRMDGALAVCIVNNHLIDGSFDYDVFDGSIVYRLTCSCRETVLNEEQLQYMIMVAASTVDNYNDKFFMIAKNMMTVEQFAESETRK